MAFTPCITVLVRHAYFRDGICPHLDFAPTQGCLRLIANAGMVLKQVRGGILLLCDESRHNLLDGFRAAGDDTLSFRVFCRDKLFMNYTRPPVWSEGRILYFLGGEGGEGGNGSPALLHPGEFASERDLRSVDDAAFQEILTAGDRFVRPIFLVTINLPGLGELQELPSGKRYDISFQTRETYWKYYVAGEVGGMNGLIVDRNDGVGFERLGEQSITGGRKGVVFRSCVPLQLRQESPYHFQLRANSGTGRVLIRRLAVAAPNGVAKESIDGKEAFVSEIYINC